MNRRSFVQSLGCIGIGLTGATRVVSGKSSDEFVASNRDVAAYASSANSSLIERWTDDNYFHQDLPLSACIDARVFQAGWNSLEGRWEITFGIAATANAPNLYADLWGHKYKLGEPETGSFLLDTSETGVYPKDNDKLIPDWVPPFIGPAASTLSGSSAPGWLVSGGLALREAMGSDDNGFNGLSSNSPGYKNANSFWDFNSLGDTTAFSAKFEWEGNTDRYHPDAALFSIKGQYKMDTPVFEDSWKGFDSGLYLNPIDDPSDMTHTERKRFGVKRVEDVDAATLDGDVDDAPEYIVPEPQSGESPLLEVRETTRVSKPAAEHTGRRRGRRNR